ncbi:Hypothetical predicted protein [Paramuricea clavata]|uniref:Integrase zinc-binding domain-containing protein n=1 Tax=Paramuricea clavata TaxID=317549 RepID=A0A7D9ECQ8_PARCT|nr:Hypothetical predicted protein [Paramuricea clavata]
MLFRTLCTTSVNWDDEYKGIEPEIVSLLLESLYVDDFAGGAYDDDEALHIYRTSHDLMGKGGFKLRKWHSNSASIRDFIATQEDANGSARDEVTNANSESTYHNVDVDAEVRKVEASLPCSSSQDSSVSKSNCVKILGISWNEDSDEFCYDLGELVEYAKSIPTTKRSVLKLSAKVFDPIGLFSPFTVTMKMLFRTLCTTSVNWDDELDGKALTAWKSLVKDLQALSDIRFDPQPTSKDNDEAYNEVMKNPHPIVHSLSGISLNGSVHIERILDPQRYSTKTKLPRVTALVIRFIKKTRKQRCTISPEVNADELKESEKLWIRSIQSTDFAEEIECIHNGCMNSRVNQLGLFVDDDKIIRCDGRIGHSTMPDDAKQPILLPPKQEFTRLIIREAHELVHHDGIRETLNCVRRKYWVLRGRESVKGMVRRCVTCKMFEAKPFAAAKEPALPSSQR